MPPETLDYRRSGVDVRAGEQAVESIRDTVRRSYNANVLSDLGSFGGLFRFHQPDMLDPVLVASTDGVGTKLRVAIMAGKYDTVGQDLVNHCVNDILVQGAEPLFFLDYIGLGKLQPEHVATLVEGMATACQANSCALIGGEMAEMPGFYQDADFDLAGTIVGVVDRHNILPAERIQAGDLLVGLPSSGLHTNGYSLARQIVFEILNLAPDSYVPDLGTTLAESLLAVHLSYLPTLKPWLLNSGLHGLAHITGGGIPGNLKRIIPSGLTARVNSPLHSLPPLFTWLREAGNLSDDTMLEAFNLGIGMIAVLAPDTAPEFLAANSARLIGEIAIAGLDEPKVSFRD